MVDHWRSYKVRRRGNGTSLIAQWYEKFLWGACVAEALFLTHVVTAWVARLLVLGLAREWDQTAWFYPWQSVGK